MIYINNYKHNMNVSDKLNDFQIANTPKLVTSSPIPNSL